MVSVFLAAGPPRSPWHIPDGVTNEIWKWINMALYVTLAGSIAALIIFGALLAVDRNRGEPVSATSPAVRGLRIALGVMIMTGAATLAQWFL